MMPCLPLRYTNHYRLFITVYFNIYCSTYRFVVVCRREAHLPHSPLRDFEVSTRYGYFTQTPEF